MLFNKNSSERISRKILNMKYNSKRIRSKSIYFTLLYRKILAFRTAN